MANVASVQGYLAMDGADADGVGASPPPLADAAAAAASPLFIAACRASLTEDLLRIRARVLESGIGGGGIEGGSVGRFGGRCG